jgi:hypothetical protein
MWDHICDSNTCNSNLNRECWGTWMLAIYGQLIFVAWTIWQKKIQLLQGSLTQEQGMSQSSAYHLLLVGFPLDLFFEPDDGDSTFLRNVSGHLPDYTVLQMRWQYSSQTVCCLNLGHCLLSLQYPSWSWRQDVCPKCRRTSTRLHRVTAQTVVLFIPMKCP